MTTKVSFHEDQLLPGTTVNVPVSSVSVVGKPTTTACVTKEKIASQYQKYCVLLKSFLLQYLGYIQSPARQEAIIKTTQYTLWLLSRFYQKLPITQSKGNTTFVESLAGLSGELSWTRYILRFFGLPAAIEAIDSGSWAGDCKRLGKAMAWTMLAYYPLEHLAYLSWKAPKTRWIPSTGGLATRWNPFGASLKDGSRMSSENTCTVTNGQLMSSSQIAAKASAWSCRFWFAYLVLDIARSMLALQKVQQKTTCTEKKENTINGETDTESATTPADRSLIRTERLQLIRDVLYLLPAIHWSLPNWDTKPWLSNDVVNGLCWLEAVVGMYQNIRNFRDQ